MLKIRQGTFLNILRWFVLATVIGVIVGVADAAFLTLLDAAAGATNGFPLYFTALPFVLWVVWLLSRRVAKNDTDFSTDAAINKINSYRGISLISTLKAFFLPVFTIAGGGSAGKEAPCADVGAGLASAFSGILNLSPEDRRKLMICGVSAGFAGVFGVPVSGAIFGLEILWVGYIFYEVMFPALVAGITAYQITNALGVTYIYHPIQVIPVFTEGFFIKILIAGVFFGLMSILFIELMKFFRVVFRFISFKTSNFWRAFLGGFVLALIGLLLSPEYLGLGMDTTNGVLTGSEVSHPLGALFKMITTAITFSAGGVGGIVTPIFFIGSQAGAVLSGFLEVDPKTLAALGVVAVLAGSTNAPLAASIMAIELFGPAVAPYATVCCVISFLMTGQRSVFHKQKVSYDKTSDVTPDAPHTGRKMPRRRASFMKLARHLIPNPAREEMARRRTMNAKVEKILEEEKDKKPLFKILKHLFPNFKDEDK
ncbi:MAG: chloride channel protein [Elusimicrobium sp.]|jgi:H+/Cl- antiporter ClcA|nr:chloride channel protein [Elusimicrobium sp.]